MSKIKSSRRPARRGAGAVVAAFTATLAGGALAFEFDTGNPDLSIRWDNTFRYNLGMRVEGRDNKIGNSAISDEGTYSFDRGDIVTNRIDLLSELDVVYKKRLRRSRVSAAGWYDAAYGADSRSNPNPPLVNIPSYVGNRSTADYTKRYYRGPSGELLDAFVFAQLRPRHRADVASSRPPSACTGASRCSSAATSTASPTRRTRSTCRRASPRRASKRRSCSGR